MENEQGTAFASEMRERMQGMQVTRVRGEGEMQSGGEGREEQGERERGRKEGGESWCGGNLTRCNTWILVF